MKIAIIGMPRTATKTVMNNMARYLKERYGAISQLMNATTGVIIPHLDEMLNPSIDLFKYQAFLSLNNVVLTDIPVTDVEEELDGRFWVLRNITIPLVVKHFPFSPQLHRMVELTDCMDRVYYLSRRDTFEHALSFCISAKLALPTGKPSGGQGVQVPMETSAIPANHLRSVRSTGGQ